MPTFRLRLEDTYWLKGFFNVGVDFQRFLTMTDGPLDVYLGDSAQPVSGRISRSANQNATPRIYGNKPLAGFFQKNYKRGAFVQVDIISPAAIRVGGGSGEPVTADQHAKAEGSERTMTGPRDSRMATALVSEFHEAMLDIYRRGKSEAGYNATRFLGMVSEHGGLETARYLLHATAVSDGYTALWERGRLDITVEAVILQPKWQSLFSKVERTTAVARLREYGFKGSLPNVDAE